MIIKFNKLLVHFLLVLIFLEHCIVILWVCRIKTTLTLPSITEVATITTQNIPLHRKPEYFVFILIISSPEYASRRLAIRETYLYNISIDSNARIGYKFVIGIKNLNTNDYETIQDEQYTYNDILGLNEVVDSYTSLTYKVLMAFRWATDTVNATFYMKTDDDTYIIIEQLLTNLKKIEMKWQQRLIVYGCISRAAFPIQSGKWEELAWFRCPTYFPFPFGVGYIISREIASYISENSHKLIMYNNEDVSIGSYVAGLKHKMIHDDGIVVWPEDSDCCDNKWLRHYQTEDQMRILHTKCTEMHSIC